MDNFLFSDGISHVIQLAVAPVFLLASISGALNVLSLRMGRIIDRGRRLNELDPEGKSYNTVEVDEEQRQLAERARLTHRAIALCTLSALFVCLVIVCLFVDAIFQLGMEWYIAFLFVVALGSLIMALVTFLREIGLGMNAFRFGRYNMGEKNIRRP
jgi:hypothetical protein